MTFLQPNDLYDAPYRSSLSPAHSRCLPDPTFLTRSRNTDTSQMSGSTLPATGLSSALGHSFLDDLGALPSQASTLPLHTDPGMYTLHNMSLNRSSVPEHERKRQPPHRLAYVEALVDTNAIVIETLWSSRTTHYNKSDVVPLRTFIQEVLKRSRTTYSTLQTALFYLYRARPVLLDRLSSTSSNTQHGCHDWREAYLNCGRRMFLASLVVASKFVQDKTYRNSAWAKIAGLPVAEINAVERIFLELIDYRLYIAQDTFQQWHHLLHTHVEARAHHRPTDMMRILATFTAPGSVPTSRETDWSISPTVLVRQPSPEPPQRKRRHAEPSSAHWLSTVYVSPCPSSPRSSVSTGYSISPSYSLASSGSNSSVIPPILSLSLPSSSASSPMQTPTQVSPIRVNHCPLFTWHTGTSPARSPASTSRHTCHTIGHLQSSKRRRVTRQEMHCSHNYAISHVRKMQQKQCGVP